MKRVLLADAGFSAIPLLNSLKELGYYVGVCGVRESDPCHIISDQSHVIDYSNIEILKDTYINYKYDYLIPGCTDISYLSCAAVAEQLSLSGYDSTKVAQKIFNKDSFRELCCNLNILSPKFCTNKLLASSLKFPILVKPTNSFSGKGIKKFSNKNEFLSFSRRKNQEHKSNKTIYEEYVYGQLYSHSAFISNGNIIKDFFVMEHSTIFPYQVNSSCLAFDLEKSIKIKVRNAILEIIKSCNLVDGLIHTQFITNNNDYWLIEMTRRCPGDLFSLLIEYSTSIQYAKLYCNSFLQAGTFNKSFMIDLKRFYSRHTLSLESQKIFLGISAEVRSKKSIVFNLKKLGEIVNPAPFDRAAVMFIEHHNFKDLKKETAILYKKIQLVT